MKGLAPLVAPVAPPVLRLIEASPTPVGGDGASHAAAVGVPRLGVPGSTKDAAWRDHSETIQAEARAALRTPLNRPPTWQVC